MATLYRKYRSKRFEDVIGQEPIVTTLINQIKLGRVGHAYLFAGSRGVGKTTCARILARAVNCLDPVNGSPCGECEVCKKLASPDSVDIIEMDAASNNGVDDARDIREKVKYAPTVGKYKVYIIDEVHMLTGGAANALLKTIEEPPEHVIFILATTEPQKLPQTILSRCIRFDFKLVPQDILKKHIMRVYDAEGIKYTPEAADEIARLGEGSVRDALSVADMLCSAADVITPEVVLALTGASDSEAISRLFDGAAARDVAGCLRAIDTLGRSGKSMSAVCRQLVTYARNVLVVKAVGSNKASSDGLVNLDRTSYESICASADKCSLSDCARLLESFGEADNGLKYSVSPRLYLETAIVKLVCGADHEDDLRKRIAALERKLSAPAADQKKNITPDPPPAPAPEKREMPAPRQDTYKQPAPEKREPKPTVRQTPFPSAIAPQAADEGEFMHKKSDSSSGMTALGKIVTYLRRSGGELAARARELLSRGVTVKERDDVIAFVVPDENYLLMSEATMVNTINDALKAVGETKPVRIEKTDEDIFHEDVAKARELFGRDCTVTDGGRHV